MKNKHYEEVLWGPSAPGSQISPRLTRFSKQVVDTVWMNSQNKLEAASERRLPPRTQGGTTSPWMFSAASAGGSSIIRRWMAAWCVPSVTVYIAAVKDLSCTCQSFMGSFSWRGRRPGGDHRLLLADDSKRPPIRHHLHCVTVCVSLSVLCQLAHIFMFAVLHVCMTVCVCLRDSTIWSCEGGGGVRTEMSKK